MIIFETSVILSPFILEKYSLFRNFNASFLCVTAVTEIMLEPPVLSHTNKLNFSLCLSKCVWM